MNPFDNLADHLRSKLPDGVQVYAYPPDVVKAPAVVIDPESAAPYTQAPGSVAWACGVDVVVSRSNVEAAVTNAIELGFLVVAAYRTAPETTRWITLGDFATFTVGGTEMFKGTVETVMITKEIV